MAPKISQLPESARNRPGTADTVYACGLVSWATWAGSGEEAFLPKTFFILGFVIFSIRDGLSVPANASLRMYHLTPKISQHRPGTADTVYACGLVSWATWAESGEEAFSPKTFYLLGLAIFSIRNSTGDSLAVPANASLRMYHLTPRKSQLPESTWDGRLGM